MLLIYVLPMFYAVPTADDYCSGIYQHLGIKNFIAHYANLYTGRLGAVALMYFTPLWSLPGSYCIGLLACWLFLIGSIFFFFNALFSNAGICKTLSLVFSICYMSCLINASESIYWYTGVVTYTVAVSLVFYLLGVMQFQKNGVANVVSFLLGFMVPMFSELYIIPLFFLIVYINFSNFLFPAMLRYHSRFALVGLILATVLFAIMPGNWVRVQQYHNNLDFFSATGTGFYYMPIFIFKICINPVFLVCLFLILVFKSEIEHYSRLRKINATIPIYAALLLLFLAGFIPAFFTGILGQHRTIDAMIPFIILLLGYATYCVPKLKMFSSMKSTVIAYKHWTSVSIVLAVLLSNNSREIFFDLVNGDMVRYRQEQEQRIAIIRNSTDAHLYEASTLVNTHTILYNYDIKPGDSTFYINYCMWEYLHQPK